MSTGRHVVKRNGSKEPVHFEKVQARIEAVANGLDVDATLIAQRVLARIYNGVRTAELDELAAQLSISLCTTNTDYGTLAARIAISNHQRSTEADFLKVVERLANQIHPKTGEPISYVSDQLVAAAQRFQAEVAAAIDHERDFLFDYFGFKTLEKAYLLKDSKGQIVERPQHLWMRVALALWPDDWSQARATYDLMSQKAMTHATPTLFNAGTPNQQMSSCYLLAMKGDSIKGIYETLEDCALISKHAGGIGLHIHNIRARGSIIRGTNGTSNGLVPMLKVFNSTARYVDQCFSPDTLVTVESGQKAIADVVAGEKIMTSEGLKTVQQAVVHQWADNMYRVTVDGRITQVTRDHDVLSVKAGGDDLATVIAQLNAGLKVLDYYTMNELNIGDFIASPNGTDFGGYALKSIQAFEKVHYDGPVYDFEVEAPNNYFVSNLGIVHNGGGRRNGSFAIYLEPWHADIEDWLRLKLNTGSEEERARDLFYGLWVPDLFMERVETGGNWTLFCPAEAPGLADVCGADFKALYERYEAEGRGRKTMPAQELWFQILSTQIETGTPYLCYKDAANAKSNQKNLGTIKSSNLCVAPETLLLTDAGEYAIASLVGQTVYVWNGECWSETIVQQTGTGQELMEVTVEDAYRERHTLACTLYHKFILADGSRADAQTLTVGTRLLPWANPLTVCDKPTVVDIQRTGRISDTYCVNEPLQHAAVFNGILTGNCTEIMEYSSPDETAVCNLASIGLPYFVNEAERSFDFEGLRAVVRQTVRNLDRVIDINFYPTPETRRSNMRHRPVGLGVQGLADVFALMRMPWETASELNQRIFEHIYYAAVEESAALAAAKGTYETFAGSPASQGILQPDLWGVIPLTVDTLDWKGLRARAAQGLRNSLLVAPMPTASTSQILGYNECIEPFTSNIYSRRTLAGEFIVINKYLMRDLVRYGIWSEDLKQKIIAQNGSVQGLAEVPATLQVLYKTAWEIKQRTLIDMAAARGAFICQSQSLNLFVPDATNAKLTSMHFYAWRQGLKTGIYYLRTRAPVMAQKFTVDPELQAAVVAANQAREPEPCLNCSA